MKTILKDNRFPKYYLQLAEIAIQRVAGVNIYLGSPIACIDNPFVWIGEKKNNNKFIIGRTDKNGDFIKKEYSRKEIFRIDLFNKEMLNLLNENNLVMLKEKSEEGKFLVPMIINNEIKRIPHSTKLTDIQAMKG